MDYLEKRGEALTGIIFGLLFMVVGSFNINKEISTEENNLAGGYCESNLKKNNALGKAVLAIVSQYIH